MFAFRNDIWFIKTPILYSANNPLDSCHVIDTAREVHRSNGEREVHQALVVVATTCNALPLLRPVICTLQTLVFCVSCQFLKPHGVMVDGCPCRCRICLSMCRFHTLPQKIKSIFFGTRCGL